jgi:hypothetical protein
MLSWFAMYRYTGGLTSAREWMVYRCDDSSERFNIDH